MPGPLRAGLMLRVGLADETFRTAGTTHLMEHLALFGLGRVGDGVCDGCVAQTTTSFQVQGSPEEVVTYLGQVVHQLHRPPLHRLSAECDVLRAEHAGPQGLEHLLLAWRYGAESYGLASTEPHGLGRLGGDDLAAWARRYAVRQNAVLWLSGPPPQGLSLALPDGEWQAPPDPWRSILPELPAALPGPPDLVGLYAVYERSYAMAALEYLLDIRLMDELRTRRAVSYSPESDLEALTASAGRVMVTADLVPGRASSAVPALVEVIQAIAGGLVCEQDLADWHAASDKDDIDPDAMLLILAMAAQDVVLGAGFTTPQQHEEAARLVTPDQVVRAAQAVMRTALLVGPEGAPIPASFAEAPAAIYPPLEKIAGTTFQHADSPLVLDEITVAEDGVMLSCWADDRSTTVPTDHAVGVLAWPDGRRVVIGDDGACVDVEPTMWVEGEHLVQLIDSTFPAELRLDQPARDPDDVPLPDSADDQPGLWYRYSPMLAMGLLILGFATGVNVLIGLGMWWQALGALIAFWIVGHKVNKAIKLRRHLAAVQERRARRAGPAPTRVNT